MKAGCLYLLKIGVIILGLVSSVISLVYSVNHIIDWKMDAVKTNAQVAELKQIIFIENIDKLENIEFTQKEENISKFDPYWNYKDTGLISADFEDLTEINSDTAGWIQVNGTNIDYPYVHTGDNKYYLTHSFNGTTNEAGWVFLDFRNNPMLSHKNNILYAHGRFDGAMFGTLKNILSTNWVKDPNNYIVKLSTKYENTLWQIFSIYTIPTTSDYLKIEFENDDDFLEFGKKLMKRSNFNFNTSITKDDKILTLSTCYNKKEKVVLHAKLIKRVEREKTSY